MVIAGDDFTLRGGSADASIKGKPKMSEQMAAQFRMPIIRLIEGSGGGGSVKTIETTGRANLPGGLTETTSFDLVANNMGSVPVVALGLGSVAGLGAARLAASHYSVMVKEIAAVFVAGPPVVERLGEPRTKQELGGWEIQLALRRGGPRGRHRGRGVRRGAPLPVLSARLDPRRCRRACAAGTIRTGATNR